MSGKMAAEVAQSVAAHDESLRQSEVSRDSHHTRQSQAEQPSQSGVLDIGGAFESAFHALTGFAHKPGIDYFRPLPDTAAPAVTCPTTNGNGVTVNTQNHTILSHGHLVQIPEKKAAAIEIKGVTNEGVVVGNYRSYGENGKDDKVTPFLAFVDKAGHLNMKENPARVLNGPGEGRRYAVSEFLGMQGDAVIAKTPDYRANAAYFEPGYARLRVSP